MMKPIIEILDAATGEVQRREMTDAEFEQHQKDLATTAKLQAEQAKAKAEANAKRQALLEKLGISEDEAKILLNG